MAGPLVGLRVVEIGDRGEVAGKLLADAGAELIRVEPPSGARSRGTGPFVGDRRDINASLHYAYLNTNKRGVTLDVAQSEGADLWRRLVAGADIVLDSAGPGVLDALGAGHDSFDDDALIWCSITPFGLTGPRRDWVVTDLVSVALGGPPMSTGYDDHDIPPIRSDGEHSLAMGGEYATIGVITAVLHRATTGRGQLVDVSIHEAVSGTTEGAFPNWEYNQGHVQRQTARHASPVISPPWQHMATDGDYSMVHGGGTPRSKEIYDRLVAWLEEHDAAEDLADPKWAEVVFTDPRSASDARAHIVDVVGSMMETMTADEAYRGGQAIHMPFAHVRRPEQNLDDPHWADRDFWVEGEVPGHDGAVRYPRAPYRFTKSQVEFRRRAPLLGEHNTEVYGGELGLDAEQLTSLAKAGAI
ncbi:MAG TPA: CaiB/BaiF CoA-transferase family protein [Dehalococcoidia bacterium]|jgi:crotonobetainyl-CoA:carnitine CoA-transferase CaiB-like acyl-CoA transferase|nr:CaiB/BaiF CoA-transferase family protein [Dehalococcoidia bacterium]